jgi:putative DNA methylase
VSQRICSIPQEPKIETSQIPVEWLYSMALREGNSKKPIYRIHKWWARRLGSVFRTLLLLAVTPSDRPEDQIISDFYSKQDLRPLVVLDPFMGGGTSIIESNKCSVRTIGVDIDPVAWFITKKEVEPCPVAEIEKALGRLEEAVGKEIESYYVTRAKDGQIVPVIYFFWVDLITCPNCKAEFEAHPHYQLLRDRKQSQQTVFCSGCHAISTVPLSDTSFICSECGNTTEIQVGTVRYGKFTCPQCNHYDSVVSVIHPGQPLPKRLFAVEYEMRNEEGKLARFYKAADSNDHEIFRKAERMLNRLWDKLPFPRAEIPVEGRSDARPMTHGYTFYHQLFNARQLLCLSLLWREIVKISDEQTREYLMIAFSDSLASNNLLCSYAFDYHKLTPLFGLHAFNVVNRPVENNVWGDTHYGRGSFLRCVKKMLKGKSYADQPYEMQYPNGRPKQIVTGERVTAEVTTSVEDWYKGNAQCLLLSRSSAELECLEAESVDLILTDPPYYDNLSYSELSDFFYVWLRDYLPNILHGENSVSTPYQQALYVIENDDPSHHRFAEGLTQVFAHCKRVLKPGGLMVFTFHHRNMDAWEVLARALWRTGFEVTNVFPVRSEGKSGFHSTSGTIKWDSVMVCRPRETEIQYPQDKKGFLYSIQTGQSSWEHRITAAELDFQWVDNLSLGYALTAQQATIRARSQNDIVQLFGGANEFLLSRLTHEQFRMLSRK